MSHIDCWATLAKMVGLTPPEHGAWTDNSGKPIYFDSIDNSAYILDQEKHSARRSWVYIDGESFMGARVDIAGDAKNFASTSLGNICGPPRTPGSVQNKTSAQPARSTI